MLAQTFIWALMAGVAFSKTCYNVTVPVPVTARNGDFGGLQTPQTNLEANMFALAAIQQGSNGTEKALTGYKTISGHYNISAEYCVPSNTRDNAPLQILTHGIGFDKTYWNLPFNNYNYSYVDYALSRGYHTFAYDRLGIGNSSHGDPKNEIQTALEVESLMQITRRIRNGTIAEIRKKPSKIIHVGHSFGSVQTYVLTDKYPDLSDGIVLTGYALNATFMPYFLAGSTLQQAKSGPNGQNYKPGYLSAGTLANTEYAFFNPGNFDPEILEFGDKIKQPVTVGELLTIGSIPKQSKFSGPVLIISGSNDLPFCGGNCLATGGTAKSIPAAAKVAFPSAKTFSAVIQPQTGHGLNLHYNATGGYKQIADFLDHNVLFEKH
ncbi:hypothetical protein N7492_002693 [Penicillium capsulatum]|uniref:AB hydrolase-1 domain-containing protein n=1 Tax=Penicillium capsulatum TaxID=69766 RepID=A0A9W9LVF9_9EURO|nr:hypothetical protein N7492_002693 [Penicillium capsulatum]KAJ6122709.1 hypothetical protein N7512_005174 [Penicillium capsulatum]